MDYTVQRTSNGKYGIWLEDEWLKTHFDPTDLECEDKAMVEMLCNHLQVKEKDLEISHGRIIAPQIPLYHILSFYSQINNGFDLVTDDYDWIISCDPIFHPVSSAEQAAQLQYFEGALEWLDQIGAEYKILPQRFESKEELLKNGELDDYLISEKSSDLIYEHWNALTNAEKAAFYFIYLNAEHNFIASFLALKQMIDAQSFGKMVTASIGVAPEFSGVTEQTFKDGWTHYSSIVEKAMVVAPSLTRHKNTI